MPLDSLRERECVSHSSEAQPERGVGHCLEHQVEYDRQENNCADVTSKGVGVSAAERERPHSSDADDCENESTHKL